MSNVRPAASPHHLVRRRLLDSLPDTPGYVVWLEAPYGYGKSVLASQWADALEKDGWRVIWLSLQGEDARTTLATHLGLSGTAPWAVLREEVFHSRTLLVLEDLIGTEEPGPLLEGLLVGSEPSTDAPPGDGSGLVLIASRQSLNYPELPKLASEGRLLRLTGADLAFTEAEAAEVFGDATRARGAWQSTRGWPLPLQFAAFTGDLPDHESLLSGVQRSVSAVGWAELLFVATLDLLPEAAATETTQELVRAGFVQRLAGGYRLHPLMAESIVAGNRRAVREQVAAQGSRLEPTVRGAAFERADYREGLHDLVVSGEGELFQSHAEQFLRWHELAPPSGELPRRAHVAIANLILNRFDVAVPEARTLVADDRLDPRLRGRLIGAALFTLAGAKRFEQAEPFLEAADALLSSLAPVTLGTLLQSLGTFEFIRGEYAAAERQYLASLAAFAEAQPSAAVRQAEVRTLTNLGTLAWEVHGNIDGMVHNRQELLRRADLDEAATVLLHQALAVSYAYAGDEAAAAAAVRKVAAHARGSINLMLTSMLAYFERDIAAFPSILAAARRWETFELAERVSALWLRALRMAGDTVSAFELYPGLEHGPYTQLELAWAHEAQGEPDAARALLEETRDAYAYREFQLQWHAVAYMLERSAVRLEELLALTQIRERILRYLGVPLSALPEDRPELTRVYPLEEVLTRGSPAAVRHRLAEIPSLRIRLLGEVSVVLLDEEVPLTERLREIITLLAMGVDRERIGEEIWPEVDVRKQRNSLGVLFNMLRRVIEPWGAPTFLLEGGLSRFTVDVHELRAALERADHERVLELYSEPFAPGVTTPLVEEERQSIREAVLQALYSGARPTEVLTAGSTSRQLSLSDAELRVRLLKRLLELDPLHEEGLQALMALLNRMGRRREAQRRFQRFEAALAAELGLEPQPATLALLSE